ncbi:hypothetical protein DSO57_1029596 [Entomophthora muscae]|uniref:Uncharacterized protein n=1 Tax=Entomophthora muscae TaxID=34485 RepID=A0ACC2TNG8_9FUNG|nr:hypothetical protein DSO57_1029596 [Entomophthora muscae]
MLRKPWESDELSEDWVDEDSLNAPEKVSSSDSSQEVRRTVRQGYGTVKISAAGPKLTLNKTATRTLQSGGTLIINNDSITAASSVSSQGTVKAANHLQWKKRTKDLFTPLQLETMFNAPGAAGSGYPSIKGAPLRRISGRRTVRFKSKPSSQVNSLAPQSSAAIKDNEVKVEDMTPLKRTRSESSGRSNSIRLSHSLLFQIDYDAKTRNCLSAIASKIEGNQDNKHEFSDTEEEHASPANSANQTSLKGSLRKMSSAPSLNLTQPSPQLPRPSSYRMLTPYPPTWQWLQAQVEADYIPPETEAERLIASDGSVEADETDVLDHEWLRQVSIEPANQSYLSNIDFVDDISASQELADFVPKASSTLNSAPSSENTRLVVRHDSESSDSIPSNSLLSTVPTNLWQELFEPERREGGRGHLGPDRAADHLKRHGVLPNQVMSGELILIKPSQVGQVPKQVNNMRFNSLQMKWEPIHVPEEEDPFVGVKTLAISPQELTQQLANLNTPAKDVSPSTSHSTPKSGAFPPNQLRLFQQTPQQSPRSTPHVTPHATPRATPRGTPQQTPHSSLSKASNAFRAALSPKNNALLTRSKLPLTTTQSLTQKHSTPTTPIRLFPSSPRLTTVPTSPKGPPRLQLVTPLHRRSTTRPSMVGLFLLSPPLLVPFSTPLTSQLRRIQTTISTLPTALPLQAPLPDLSPAPPHSAPPELPRIDPALTAKGVFPTPT